MHYVRGIIARQKVTAWVAIRTGEQSAVACQTVVAYRMGEARCAVHSLGTPWPEDPWGRWACS
jgi:hypothetical protein